jgi:predicted metal-binding protein
VRLKSHYGCRGYGSHFCCPPFALSPQETRQALSEYRYVVRIRIQVPPSPDPSPDSGRSHVFGYKTKLQKAVFELEKKDSLSGCIKMERSRFESSAGMRYALLTRIYI